MEYPNLQIVGKYSYQRYYVTSRVSRPISDNVSRQQAFTMILSMILYIEKEIMIPFWLRLSIRKHYIAQLIVIGFLSLRFLRTMMPSNFSLFLCGMSMKFQVVLKIFIAYKSFLKIIFIPRAYPLMIISKRIYKKRK